MGILKVSAASAVLFFGCSWIIAVTLALDMGSFNENSCFPVKPVQFDMDWAFKQHFYMPMASRSQLYSIIAQMLIPIRPSEIIDGSIYYDSCIRWQFLPNSSVTISGYGGRKETNYLTGLVPEINGGFFKPTEGNGHNGTWWTIKTDNKTYAVHVGCSNGIIGWVVLSTAPVLLPETREDIKKHLIDAGFNPIFFTEIRYDTCYEHQYYPCSYNQNYTNSHQH